MYAILHLYDFYNWLLETKQNNYETNYLLSFRTNYINNKDCNVSYILPNFRQPQNSR